MRIYIVLIFTCYAFNLRAQAISNHMIEPTGVYKEISKANDLNVIELMTNTMNNSRIAAIDSVERHANKFTPPVLYILSHNLFLLNKKEKAAYWFYIAQLRARYDVNRCADKTANASRYNNAFGPEINQYASKNLDSLKDIVRRVVAFVEENNEEYDHRWINMEGMDAVNASLGKSDSKVLSLPKEQWPSIKKKTIREYYEGFNEFLNKFKKD